jgi:hypothetical protein
MQFIITRADMLTQIKTGSTALDDYNKNTADRTLQMPTSTATISEYRPVKFAIGILMRQLSRPDETSLYNAEDTR